MALIRLALLFLCAAIALEQIAGSLDGLPWQVPCDKSGLCRRFVQDMALASALCAQDAQCVTPQPSSCFSGDLLLLPFRCSLAECIEVSTFATTIAECGLWFPPRSPMRARLLQQALVEARARRYDNSSVPALAAAVKALARVTASSKAAAAK